MGLVERPGSIESGDVPRYSCFQRDPPMSELSIFIDESGDFGPDGLLFQVDGIAYAEK